MRGHDVEGLAAAIVLAQQGLADHDRIEGRDIGAHRQPVDRRRGDERQFADPDSASCRVRGIGVAVSVSTCTFALQLLQPLLVLDAEMLLLVDDQEPEVAEFHVLGEQRMRADDDVDAAVGQPRPDPLHVLARHEPRRLLDLDRETLEARLERREMLAGEQRGRHDDRHLLAAHRREEGRPQRHFRLAEPDVAADEPVHGPPAAEIRHRGLNGGELVVRLLVGEAGAELVVERRRRA